MGYHRCFPLLTHGNWTTAFDTLANTMVMLGIVGLFLSLPMAIEPHRLTPLLIHCTMVMFGIVGVFLYLPTAIGPACALRIFPMTSQDTRWSPLVHKHLRGLDQDKQDGVAFHDYQVTHNLITLYRNVQLVSSNRYVLWQYVSNLRFSSVHLPYFSMQLTTY